MARRGIKGKAFSHGARNKPVMESGNDVSSKLLVNALRSGTLNLQNREMTVIPDDVYRLNDPELLKSLVGDSEDLKWWETEPIAKLYLCSNKITTVTPAISGLSSLTLLDLRDNQLESVPEELAQLEVLVRLELSHNKLTTLPTSLGPALQHISLNNNYFEVFPPAISSLRSLQALDLRENRLTSLGELPCCLQSLTVDDNKLTTLHLENHPTLTTVLANNNTINSVKVGSMPQLKVLSVRVNKLESLEPILNCPVLNEILVGKNSINSLEFVGSCTESLVVLDCSDNKVSTLPEFITSLTGLRRLDLSNNDLNNLPPQLGLMDNLDALLVEGNPLRAIRREIISKGTVSIKEHLKLKVSHDELEEQGPTIPDIKPDEVMLQTKALELDRTAEVAPELWDQALVCGILRLSMQHCALTQVPEQAFNLRACLQDLDLSSNNLQQLPAEIGKLVKLKKLNVINNKLRELPEEFSNLASLEELNLGQNKFEAIPDCIYNLQSLGCLIVSNNNISAVEPSKLMGMLSLVSLDLENNNIGRLNPELSLIPNLRTLLVLGNTFKIPRADVMAKGSTEVLAWLKNRVPQP